MLSRSVRSVCKACGGGGQGVNVLTAVQSAAVSRRNSSQQQQQQSEPVETIHTTATTIATPVHFHHSRHNPLILDRWQMNGKLPQPVTSWVESLENVRAPPSGLVTLHPDVFRTPPRIDLLQLAVHWQDTYRVVNWEFYPTRAEMVGGGRKERPQKKTGMARQAGNRAPHWVGGGKTFGPRGPISKYSLPPKQQRALALRSALTVKFQQNNLKFVENLEIPPDQSFLDSVRKERYWGVSSLFIGNEEMEDISDNLRSCLEFSPKLHYLALKEINVRSLMKFASVVISLECIDELEARLLYHKLRYNDDSRFPGTDAVLDHVRQLSK